MNRISTASLLLASALAAGCASPGPGGYYPAPATSASYPAASQGRYTGYGVVDSIQVVNAGGGQGGIGAGAVLGGVVGGILGNQVGSGTGRGVATAAGVVGGALAGNQLEQRNKQAGTAYQIGVRMDNGSYQTFTQDSIGDMNIGNRVRIDNGRVYRY
jgi:outer membrane lipoprotein SlyB